MSRRFVHRSSALSNVKYVLRYPSGRCASAISVITASTIFSSSASGCVASVHDAASSHLYTSESLK